MGRRSVRCHSVHPPRSDAAIDARFIDGASAARDRGRRIGPDDNRVHKERQKRVTHTARSPLKFALFRERIPDTKFTLEIRNLLNSPSISLNDRPSRLGFTLLELMVVVSIIAILAALLVPAFSRMKIRSKTLQCASQMRQISTYLNLYIGDNNGEFPDFRQTGGGGGIKVWRDYLFPYGEKPIANRPETYGIWYCPEKKLAKGSGWWTCVASYGGNHELSGSISNPASGYKRMVNVDELSRTMLAVDTTILNGWHSIQRNNGTSAITKWTDFRHDGRANMVYLDGHVESIAPEDVTTKLIPALKPVRPNE